MKKLTKNETLSFNEEEWYFEVQSGYAGWKNKVTDEWLYESDYTRIISNRESYKRDYHFIKDFDMSSFNVYSREHIEEYLDNLYFNEEN